jgi:hypothetical protein
LKDAIINKLIIPSEIERGRPYQVNMINERNRDSQVVEGDDINLQFAFNNVLFNKNDFKLQTNPDSCQLNSEQLKLNVNSTHFKNTHLLQLRFKNITTACNYNYTLNLKVNSHPHFADTPFIKPTNPSLFYNLNAQRPIKPYFIDKQTNLTIEVFNATQNSNETIFVTTADINVESDRTIELNCQAFGKPRPTIVWYKDNRLLNLTDEKYKLGDGSLKLFRTHAVDSGLYQCQVSNRYGRIERSFNVQVESTSVKKVQKQRIIIIWGSIGLMVVSVSLVVALVLFWLQIRANSKLKVKLYHSNFFLIMNFSIFVIIF